MTLISNAFRLVVSMSKSMLVGSAVSALLLSRFTSHHDFSLFCKFKIYWYDQIILIRTTNGNSIISFMPFLKHTRTSFPLNYYVEFWPFQLQYLLCFIKWHTSTGISLFTLTTYIHTKDISKLNVQQNSILITRTYEV